MLIGTDGALPVMVGALNCMVILLCLTTYIDGNGATEQLVVVTKLPPLPPCPSPCRCRGPPSPCPSPFPSRDNPPSDNIPAPAPSPCSAST